jgi:hypothetical protein
MPRDFHVHNTKAWAFERIGFMNKSVHGPKFKIFDAETADLLGKRVQKARVKSDNGGFI